MGGDAQWQRGAGGSPLEGSTEDPHPVSRLSFRRTKEIQGISKGGAQVDPLGGSRVKIPHMGASAGGAQS